MSIGETVFGVITNQVVASSGTSVASSAFPDGTEAVRLVCTEDAFFNINATAVAAGSTTGCYLVADIPEYFIARPGQKVNVIQDSAAGSLKVAHLRRD